MALRYRLRTLLIVLALGPPVLAAALWAYMAMAEPRQPADGTILYHGGGPPTVYGAKR